MAALVARRALTRGCFVGRKAFRYSSPIRSLFRGNRSSFGVDFAETLSTMECSIMAIEGATTSEFTLSKFVSARDRGRFETWQHKQSPPFANIKYKNAYTRDTKTHNMRRFVVFPGSFNPPHEGHMGLVESGLQVLTSKFTDLKHITMVCTRAGK